MCNQTTEETKYKTYDNVVQTIMVNVLVEHERHDKYLLYNFQPSDDANKLYFNITAVAADLNKKNIYLDMPFWDYIKFRKKRSKKRTNLKWFNPIQKRKLSEEDRISVDTIMNFVCEQLNLNYRLFKEINDEYYGWVE